MYVELENNYSGNFEDQNLDSNILGLSKNEACCRRYCKDELGLVGAEKRNCKKQCKSKKCDKFKEDVLAGKTQFIGAIVDKQLSKALQNLDSENDQLSKVVGDTEKTGSNMMTILIIVVVVVLIGTGIVLLK